MREDPGVGTAETLLVALVMAVGVVGVLVPLLPGLALVWAAGLVWVLGDGGGVVRWTVLVLMTVLLVAGAAAKWVLPARSVRDAGAPRSTLLVGAVGAVVGFFVIPVVGLVIGGVGVIYLAERRRLGDGGLAWRSTRATLLAVGIGMLLELAAAFAMVLTWALGVAVT